MGVPVLLKSLQVFAAIAVPFCLFIYYRAYKLRGERRYYAAFLFVNATIALVITINPFLSLFDDTLSVRGGSDEQNMLVYGTDTRLLKDLRLVDWTDSPPFLIKAHMRYKDSVGLYSSMERSIFIPHREGYLDYDSQKGIWLHELGHHVWYYHLTAEERAQFRAIYDREIALFESGVERADLGFITLYATTNVEEDWAESFYTYMDVNSHDRLPFLFSERGFVVGDFLERYLGCRDPSSGCGRSAVCSLYY